MTRLLGEVLGALLPDRTEALLLRSCLAEGDACHQAWAAFQREARELTELFRTDRGELKRLGPLLQANLRRNHVDVERGLLTVLRTGYVREELRTRIYLEVFGEAARALHSAGVEPLVIRGAALASAYGDPALRHSHDIDLLLAETELPAATAALLDAGFSSGAVAPTAEMTHATSLPIRLHTQLFELSAHPRSTAELRARSLPASIGGEPVRVPAPEDQLAQVLGHAAYSPGRASLQWACDAWKLAERHPDLDAGVLAEGLATARLELPAAVLLEGLTRLGAPVPDAVLATVGSRANSAGHLQRDLALHGLRRGMPGGLGAALRRMPGLRARAAALGWSLLPSLDYLRWAHQPRRAGMAPAYYVIRVLRAAGVTRGRTGAGV